MHLKLIGDNLVNSMSHALVLIKQIFVITVVKLTKFFPKLDLTLLIHHSFVRMSMYL
jgi:hypothetical protein